MSSSPYAKNVLFLLLRKRRWDELTSRTNTEEGREDLRRKDLFGELPLHEACSRGAPLELVEVMLGGYKEAVRVTDDWGKLPLHYACNVSPPVVSYPQYHVDVSSRVVRLLLDAHPEGAKAANMHGFLPLHEAAQHKAPLEVLTMLITAHPEGVTTRDKNGRLPLHRLANKASTDKKEDVAKVELLIRPLIKNEEVCRTVDSGLGGNDMLPLHVAAKFDLSIDIFRALLSTYGDAAKEKCKHKWNDEERTVYALDLLEEHRPGRGTAGGRSSEEEEPCPVGNTWTTTSYRTRDLPAAVPSAARWGSETCSRADRMTPTREAATETRRHSGNEVHIVDPPRRGRHERGTEEGLSSATKTPAADVGDGNAQGEDTVDGPVAVVTPWKRRRTMPSSHDRSEGNDAWNDAVVGSGLAEFDKKSDLLFSYNPNILPYRKDPAHLERFVIRISREAKERYLSEPALRIYHWMSTFWNESDPSDSYLGHVDDILRRIDDAATVEWLGTIRTTTANSTGKVTSGKCFLVDPVREKKWDIVEKRMDTQLGRWDVRSKDDLSGRLPLHWACHEGAPFELVERMLVANPVAVRVGDADNMLPLHCVCKCDDPIPCTVRRLLDENPGAASEVDSHGQLPLHCAAKAKVPREILEMLLDRNPQGATTRDLSGALPVHVLADHTPPNDPTVVDRAEVLLRPLLDNKEACMTAAGDNCMLPLHIAVLFQLSTDILQSLLASSSEAVMKKCYCPVKEGKTASSIEVNAVQLLNMLSSRGGSATDEDRLVLEEKRSLLLRKMDLEEQKDLLLKIINSQQWDEVGERMQTHEGKEALRMFHLYWALYNDAPLNLISAIVELRPGASSICEDKHCHPLHLPCLFSRSDSPRLLQLLIDAYPNEAKAIDSSGKLPIHVAASENAGLEVLRILFDVYPEGAVAFDDYGQLPLHLLADNGSTDCKEDAEKVHLLIRPALKDKELCKAAGCKFDLLPLHIAAMFDLPMKAFQELLAAYGEAARKTCRLQLPSTEEENIFPLDLLEMRRPEHGTAEELSEFNQKSDLLFKYSPDIPRYRTEDRLERLLVVSATGNADGSIPASAVTPSDDPSTSAPRPPKVPVRVRNAQVGTSQGIHRKPTITIKEVKFYTPNFGSSPPFSAKDNADERLPLHFALTLGAKMKEVQTLLGRQLHSASLADRHGRFPLHIASKVGADKKVLELLLASYPRAATVIDSAGDLPVHHFARTALQRNLDGVGAAELLLDHVSKDSQACESTGSIGVLLPLHIAAQWNIKYEIMSQLLTTFPLAASQLHVKLGVSNQYAIDILESKRPRDTSSTVWKDEFNLKSDLLFAYNPVESMCSKDSERLFRLKIRIRDEAESGDDLSLTARKVWVWLCTQGNYEEDIRDILNRIPFDAIEHLASIKTPTGHPILTGSKPACGLIIRSFLLFFGRYDILKEEKPLHESQTCVVLRARDYGGTTKSSDNSPEHGHGGDTHISVVIKFMRNKHHFDREVSLREDLELVDGIFPAVVPCIDKLDLLDKADRRFHSNNRFRVQWKGKGSGQWQKLGLEYRYALVMPEAERTLDYIYRHERPGINEVRSMMEQIGKALQIMHDKRIIHGDLKPLNVVRLNGRMALIDLDASCTIQGHEDFNEDSDFFGAKYSSGVLPPEMVDLLNPDGIAKYEKYWARVKAEDAEFWEKIKPKVTAEGKGLVVKTFRDGVVDIDDLPYILLLPSERIDVWSFGILFVTIFSGQPLFNVSRDDDLSSTEDFLTLLNWKDGKALTSLVQKNSDTDAIELLEKLLARNPQQRLKDMSYVLRHDFFHPELAKKRLQSDIEDLSEELQIKSQGREDLMQLIMDMPFNELIRKNKWKIVRRKIIETPSSLPTGLLHLVCQHHPPRDVVRSIIDASAPLLKEKNDNDNLAIHEAARYGAGRGVFEELVDGYSESVLVGNKKGETPLHIIQSNIWLRNNKDQAEVIDYIRRQVFPGHYDSSQMTGLPKKSGFHEWGHIAPPEYHDVMAMVVFVDISGFKSVNDKAGMDEGDKVIKKYANCICDTFASSEGSDHINCCVTTDVFRMGGDEFAIVVKVASKSGPPNLRRFWNKHLRQKVDALSDLEFNGKGPRGRYYTFARIGCSCGKLSSAADVDSLRLRSEKLQEEVKGRIKFERGESISLANVRSANISNVKLCSDLDKL